MFISQWSQTLTQTDRFGQNVLHSVASGSRAKSISFLSELFAQSHPEILKKALQAKDLGGKTPLDLAKNDETRMAITKMQELVNKS
jgi:hypothetical protein